MTTPTGRDQERERLINADEFSTGFYTNENYCARMKKHIEQMKLLGGDHLNDIAEYMSDMKKANGGKGCPSSGGRRANKHSNKHYNKHSKKHSKNSKKSKKTKSRRH